MITATPTPVEDVETPQQPYGCNSVSYLNGKKPLWKAFWIVFILGNTVMGMGAQTIYAVAHAISVAPATDAFFNPYHVAYFYLALTVSYFFYSAIVLWRCAPTTSIPGMRYAVRTCLAVLVVFVLFRLTVVAVSLVGRLYG